MVQRRTTCLTLATIGDSYAQRSVFSAATVVHTAAKESALSLVSRKLSSLSLNPFKFLLCGEQRRLNAKVLFEDL